MMKYVANLTSVVLGGQTTKVVGACYVTKVTDGWSRPMSARPA